MPLTAKRGCRMVVPLFMWLVLTLQTGFFSWDLWSPKQPYLGWLMTSISVHLQVFCCSTRLCCTPALVMGSAVLDLCYPGRCLEPRTRAVTSLPCSLAGAMRWPWCSAPKAAASPQCAPKRFVGKQQRVLS